jgi:hypothetical protein
MIEKMPFYKDMQEIITKDEWVNQSAWIKDSPLVNKYYVPLTLIKMWLLGNVADTNPLGSKRFYWIDSGFTNSFGVQEPITEFNFLKLPKDNFAISSYPYNTNSEIHGCNINVISLNSF